jgi:predicted RNase H-like HicB family nuclease
VDYRIVLHRDEEGFSVSCPDLPGCWSQGKTEKEARTNIRHAIREYLAVAKGISQAEVRGIDSPAADTQQAHQ